MRAREFTDLGEKKERFKEMFSKFLPLCMKILKLESLPEMEFQTHVDDSHQPTFGQYNNGQKKLHVALANRHPNDVLRTIAHELQHYKQDIDNRLDDHSGDTGSPIENEAHAMAGIVMRHFNKQYPEYLSDKPIIL
jgi:Zn-dependent peptidase ImmA (M78 family)